MSNFGVTEFENLEVISTNSNDKGVGTSQKVDGGRKIDFPFHTNNRSPNAQFFQPTKLNCSTNL